NGAPVKVPKRKLKDEAVSTVELKEWGDVVTLDFVFPEDQMDDDFVMKMLTVKDVYTNFIGAYPVDTRSEVNVRNSLEFFMGDRKIKLLCGDNAEEFEKAANSMEIPFDNSVPNRKQTNAIVERKLSTKFGPDAVTGVFAGYVTTAGESWRREYLAWYGGTAGDGNIYVDDDGYNVKLDKLGRRYRVRSDGVREVPASRPLGIPPEAWARMSEREKEEAIRTRDAVERKSKAKAASKAAPKTKVEGEAAGGDAPIESEENEFEGYSPDAEPSGFPLDPEAEEVERYARERGVESDTETEAEPAAPGVEVEIDHDNDYQFYHDGFEVPEWEEIASVQEHNEKIAKEEEEEILEAILSRLALVSRPVGRKEMLANPKAIEAVKKEWTGLNKRCWEFESTREKDDVAREARESGEEIHFARAHTIMVEKHRILDEDDPRRKFK
ncbi:unnamed protein product, partial [Symbiodinium pilosum]